MANSDPKDVRFCFPAHLRSSPAGVRVPETMDATIFTEHPPIYFTAEISNNSLDAYYTRMAPSSLKNYEKDAKAGVSFVDSHRTDKLGIGYSLDARYIDNGDGEVRVEADFYTLGGLPDQDAFIAKLRSGLARDVSIGWYSGDIRCSICTRSLFDWECPHIPGMEYSLEQRNEAGEVTGETKELAIGWVEDARLAEVSAVFDGATPGASIIKAQIEAEAGRLSPSTVQLLEQRYRGLKLRRPDPSLFIDERRAAMPVREPEVVTELPAAAPPPAVVPPVPEEEEKKPEVELSPEALDEDTEGALLDRVLAEAELPGDRRVGLRTLAALAKEGRAYRASLVDEALVEGVRVLGASFEPDTFRAIFSKADVTEIRAVRDSWKKQAAALFPGGKHTVDTAPVEEDEPERRIEIKVPSHVYQ